MANAIAMGALTEEEPSVQLGDHRRGGLGLLCSAMELQSINYVKKINKKKDFQPR